MHHPRPIKSAWWITLLVLPVLIWLVVFVVLAPLPAFEPWMRALEGGCESFARFLPACADLDAPQRGSSKVPREFLAASHIVTLGATAVTLALALLLGTLASLTDVAGNAPQRGGWMLWLAVAVIAGFLVLFLPVPSLKMPNSSFVSLVMCLAGGFAAMIVYVKVVGLRGRLSRGRRRGLP